MPITALTCPACGAPVTPRATDGVRCTYCRHTLAGVVDARWDAMLRAAEERDDDLRDTRDGRAWCRVAGRKLLLRGLLARGSACDVFFAERAARPTELLVVKVGYGDDAREMLAREWSVVSRLAESDVRGAALLTTLLPQPVMRGDFTTGKGEVRPAVVYRWRSGYQCSLADVRRVYPDGVDARTAVWMWRRVLELLAWIHGNGVRHGAVAPAHILVHPRDHGVALVGWSRATPFDAAIADGNGDVRDSARALLQVVGGRADAAARVPGPLRALLDAVAAGGRADAAALSREVLAAATSTFGPPRFHPFTMPGWQ